VSIASGWAEQIAGVENRAICTAAAQAAHAKSDLVFKEFPRLVPE
jgi:hypothetical protein